MTSAAGIWLATHDETGQRCWVNNVTHERVYRIGDNVEPLGSAPSTPASVIFAPVRPVVASMTPSPQGMRYNMLNPNTGQGTQYMFPGEGYSGGFFPPSPTGHVGMGTTDYPSGWVNWF